MSNAYSFRSTNINWLHRRIAVREKTYKLINSISLPHHIYCAGFDRYWLMIKDPTSNFLEYPITRINCIDKASNHAGGVIHPGVILEHALTSDNRVRILPWTGDRRDVFCDSAVQRIAPRINMD